MKKKYLALALSGALAVGMFTGCGSSAAKKDDKATNEETKEKVIDGNEKETEKNEYKLEDYVSVNSEETSWGSKDVVVLNEELLDSDYVKENNARLAEISDAIDNSIVECENIINNDGLTDYEIEKKNLCEVKATLNENVLSISVHYLILNFYSCDQYIYNTINIDINTGEELSYEDVLEAVGSSEMDVENSISQYIYKAKENENDKSMLYNCGMEKNSPDSFGDHEQWEDYINNTVEEFNSLKRFFVDENNRINVAVFLETEASSVDTMITVASSNEEVLYLNPNDPYGMPFTNLMMDSQIAASAILDLLCDYDGKTENGVKLSTMTHSMDLLENAEGNMEPVYIVQAFEDMSDHIATYGWYCVGAYTGTIWEYDIVSDAYNIIPNGTGALKSDVYTMAHDNNALAVIYNNPSEYEVWGSNVFSTIDLISYGSNIDRWTAYDAENFLLIAANSELEVSFAAVGFNGEDFEVESTYYTLTLPKYESVSIWARRPEGVPSQAIIVSDGEREEKYIITYDGRGSEENVEFIGAEVE